MGIDHPRATADEKPGRQIYLSTFSIDRYEVTNDLFAAFVAATGYQTAAEQSAAERADGLSWRHPFHPDSAAVPDHPVVYVSWQDAHAYCAWRGGRLPTEAEWEKSARGSDGRLWPWGAAFAAGRANIWGAEDGYARLAPVGSFPLGASPYGALDMAGNVWEWCADWYDPEYYATAPTKDPQGPETGRFKVLRGGSWINPGGPVLRSSNRFEVLPVERSTYIGFRCARSP